MKNKNSRFRLINYLIRKNHLDMNNYYSINVTNEIRIQGKYSITALVEIKKLFLYDFDMDIDPSNGFVFIQKNNFIFILTN